MSADFPCFFDVTQMLCHRVDLQNELLDLATRKDGPGKPCKLELGEQVVSCDAEFGSVTLKNGMMISADVIIGADGIRSTVSRKPLPPSSKIKTFILIETQLWGSFKTRSEMLSLIQSILLNLQNIAHIEC